MKRNSKLNEGGSINGSIAIKYLSDLSAANQLASMSLEQTSGYELFCQLSCGILAQKTFLMPMKQRYSIVRCRVGHPRNMEFQYMAANSGKNE